jgi:hypothetical protein
MRQLPSRGNSGFMDDKEVALDAPATEVAEKSLTTSQVNDIVKREKARAAERARLDEQERHREELERVRQSAPPQAPDINIEEIEKRVYGKVMDEARRQYDENERLAHEAQLKQVADQYYLKMGKGSELFEDFNEVMGEFEPSQFPNAVMLAAGMENTPEIMYELANNPSKLQEIDSLAMKSPKLAQKQLERLSKSINQNLQAKNNNVDAPPPLSRLKSSSVGADSGKMSLKDYKNAPWLRG